MLFYFRGSNLIFSKISRSYAYNCLSLSKNLILKHANSDPRLIQRALISVSDKSGIVILFKLSQFGIDFYPQEEHLNEAARIPVTEVSEYTEFPEIMDGRVKTLHPKYMEAYYLGC